MKILLTNGRFARRGGTELYLKDVALGLQKRGHMPFIYSPTLGEVAKELRAAVIPVVDDLKKLSVVPDVIHGQHHMEAMTALLHFSGVPAVYFCHVSGEMRSRSFADSRWCSVSFADLIEMSR